MLRKSTHCETHNFGDGFIGLSCFVLSDTHTIKGISYCSLGAIKVSHAYTGFFLPKIRVVRNKNHSADADF